MQQLEHAYATDAELYSEGIDRERKLSTSKSGQEGRVGPCQPNEPSNVC